MLFTQLQRNFPSQSIVGKIHSQKYDASKHHLQGCHLARGKSCTIEPRPVGAGLIADKEPAESPVHVDIAWMMVRASREYAAKLARELDAAAGARGHHEALSGP